MEQDIGGKAKKHMKTNKIKYTDSEMGNFEIINDFLPSPSDLVKMENNIKVTINLRKSSVDFFKEIAKKNHVQYQRVIRSLLDTYANAYSK